MPPRIPTRLMARCRPAKLECSNSPSLVGLFAALSIQTRSAHILASLSDNKGAYNKKRRVGRGPSSGYGKTSGRGQKGTRARNKPNKWFQGGQTPLIFSKGKFGFENMYVCQSWGPIDAQHLGQLTRRADVMSTVNLDKLQDWIDQGRIDPKKQITPKELIKSNLVGSIKDGIKLLGRGADALKQPINIIVSRASSSAIDAVEKAGGRIITRYYTKQAIRRLVEGKSINTDYPLPVGAEHVEPILAEVRQKGFFYRLPDPTSRWDIEYYRDPAHRGYLSHMLEKGESPSLFFKIPPKTLQRKKKVKGDKVEDTKLWEKL